MDLLHYISFLDSINFSFTSCMVHLLQPKFKKKMRTSLLQNFFVKPRPKKDNEKNQLTRLLLPQTALGCKANQ